MPGHTKSYKEISQFGKCAVLAKTSETGSTEASALTPSCIHISFFSRLVSVQIDKCKSSVKTALKELDDVGLLVRRSGGFSKPNHLYVKIPSDEIGLQTVDNKAVEKMAVIESEKHPSSGRKMAVQESEMWHLVK